MIPDQQLRRSIAFAFSGILETSHFDDVWRTWGENGSLVGEPEHDNAHSAYDAKRVM